MLLGMDILENFLLSHSLDEVIIVRLNKPVFWDDCGNKRDMVEYILNNHRIELVNNAFTERYNIDPQQVIGQSLEVLPGYHKSLLKTTLFDLCENRSLYVEQEHDLQNQSIYWTKNNYTCCYDSDGFITGFLIIQRDITQDKINEQTLFHQKEVLQRIASEKPLNDVLRDIRERIERLCPGAICSILEIRNEKTIRVLAAPALLDQVSNYLEGKTISANSTPCELAVLTKKIQIIENVNNHSFSPEYKKITKNIGFPTVYVVPVFDIDKKVIALLNIYYKSEKRSSNLDLELIKCTGNLVEIVLEREYHHQQIEKQQELLTESELFYKSIVQNGPDAFAVIDSKGLFTYVSPPIKKSLGYSPEELIGTSILNYIKEDDIGLTKEIYNNVIAHKSIPKVEIRMRHKDGKPLYIEINPSLKIPESPDEGLILSIWDVTERKEQEKRLRELQEEQARAKAWFQKLAETTPDFITIWDLSKDKPVYFNKEKPFGVEIQKIIKDIYFIESVHPEDRERVITHRENLRKSHYALPSEIEYRIKFRNNEWDWIYNRYNLMEKDKQGNPVLILIAVTVITEKRKVLQALEESRGRLLALIENTSDSIWSIDRNYNLTAFNSGFIQRHKYYYDKIPQVGQNAFIYSSEEENEYWLNIYSKVFEGQSISEDLFYNLKNNPIYFEVLANPILGKKGKVEGVTCFLRDVTEKKLSETELKRANFELDSFVYRASHDMMAPLRSILGLVEIVKMEKNRSEQYRFLDLIGKSVSKLDVFIRDLTAFSRNSRLPTVSTAIDFQTIIESTIEDLAFMPNAGRLNITIEVRQKSEFCSDPARIDIIFHNLISNAIKYQRLHIDDSQLHISVHSDENEAEIVVKDNGMGIKAEYIGKIFDMFFRASEESYGSGLGLYILKQVVEKLHGRIENVESGLGAGTTFVIVLANLKGKVIS
ncbi:MAG TPA: PAS domain S-box protein [Cytophagales bacterium]|nr:PAS domain S-box protein [Cytophagales bacterium]